MMYYDPMIEKIVLKLSKDIYQDGLQPSVQTLGQELAQIFSALKIVTLPFATMGHTADYLLEKYKIFLHDSINKVKPENRIPPPPRISTPILQNVQVVFEQKDIYELYSNLLASASDKNTCDAVHPAFITIVSQLTSLEVILLEKFKPEFVIPYYLLQFYNPDKHISFPLSEPVCFIDGIKEDYTALTSGLENLQRLGLIYRIPNLRFEEQGDVQVKKDNLIALLAGYNDSYSQLLAEVPAQKLRVEPGFFRPTILGRKFLSACSAPQS